MPISEATKVYRRRYYEEHREELIAAQKKRDQKNCEKVRIRKKLYAIENAEHIAQYHQNYHIKHRDTKNAYKKRLYLALTLTQKEERRAKGRAWERLARQRNPEQFRLAGRAKQARRRARKRGLPDTWVNQDTKFTMNYWNYSCAVCGRENGFWYIIALDHAVPLTETTCPGTVPGNILPLCHAKKDIPASLQQPCNNRKGVKNLQTWLAEKLGKRKGQKKWKDILLFFAIHEQQNNATCIMRTEEGDTNTKMA